MLISNKLHSFRNFDMQTYKKKSNCLKLFAKRFDNNIKNCPQ